MLAALAASLGCAAADPGRGGVQELVDFSRAGHGWRAANHVANGRQTATGYAFDVTGEETARRFPSDKDVMVPFGVLAENGKLVVSGILREGAWERPLPPEAFVVVNYATGARHMVGKTQRQP